MTTHEALLQIRTKVAASPRTTPWKVLWNLCLPKAQDERVREPLNQMYDRLLPNHVGPLTQEQRLAIIDLAISRLAP